MRQIAHHIQTIDIVFTQYIHCMAIGLTKYRSQYTATTHFLFTRALAMENCTLQYALKAQRRLSFHTLKMLRQ